MTYQSTFKRYELKYMLTERQKKQILRAMKPFMEIDGYGRTVIRNIYVDTDNFRLIRRSLEKPVYKEKLRIRSYRPASQDEPVFVELKKKYKSVVYKRRIILPESQVMESFRKNKELPVSSQIGDEIAYFRSYYGNLKPKVFLTYEREAYYCTGGGDFRVTFDENIFYRETDLSLGSRIYGSPILEKGQTLMEIKTSGGIPLWMCHELNRFGICRTSFSKYGTAYRKMKEENILQIQRRA